MKLLTKTSLWYLIIAAIILSIGGVVFFYELRSSLDEEATENLYGEKEHLVDFLAEQDSVPTNILPIGDDVKFVKTNTPVKEWLTDTIQPNPYDENEPSPYRVLCFPAKIGDEHVAVYISKPLFESDDLFESITWSLLILSIILLVALFLLNRFLFRHLWNPFYKTMQVLRKFDVKNAGELQLPKTGTKEFRELNDALTGMTSTITKDFHNLKAFTENAAHELQTPLAIIRSKAEILLQSGDLTENAARTVQQVFDAAHRLSKINQALLLLAKIENRQYPHTERINFSNLLREKLEHFAELIESKSLMLRTDIRDDVHLLLHPLLAEILLNNLLGNAIRHTAENDIIAITLTDHKLEIGNSGKPLQSSPEKLFERFHKENPDAESAGLGLAIVQSIADTAQLRTGYRYEEGMHIFTIAF